MIGDKMRIRRAPSGLHTTISRRRQLGARRAAVERLERRSLLSASPAGVDYAAAIEAGVEDGTVLRPAMTGIKSESDAATRGPAGYQLQVVFPDNSLTASQKAIFTTAANRWMGIILGEISDVTANFGNGTETIDDLRIEATAPPIDGPGGILGSAGPEFIRINQANPAFNFLPITGGMEFDSADVAALESSGQLDEVILHEMAHVIGLGTIWGINEKNLRSGTGGPDPRYTGALGNAQYQAIFGLAAGNTAPIENTGGGGTRDAHWREATFNNELMTGFLDNGANPISLLTIAQWADMGYPSVNLNGFELYTPPGGGNVYPTIGSLSDSPDPAPTNSNFTLTANTVSADTASVRFYRETNGIAGLQVIVGTTGDIQADLLLSTDSSSSGGFTANVPTTGLANGPYTYYAQATDTQNLVSVNVSTTHTVGAGAVSATPGTPDLVAATDTGSSNTDNLTNRDNSAAAKNLQFSVPGTVSGATVTIFSDGVAIGSAVAAGTTTTVTTNGTTDLLDGGRAITARQTEPGKTQSAASAGLTVTIDTTAPTGDVLDVNEPRTTSVASVNVAFNQAVAGFDFADLTLTRNGINVPLTASNNPTSSDGGVNWNIPNLTTPTNPSGMYVLTVRASGSGITDAAGNLFATSASDTWVNGNALPVVTDVFIAGSTWATGFRTTIANAGLGNATHGYRLLATEHADELPWTNLNQVSIRFSENVNVAANDLVVRGVNNATYALAAVNPFVYDQFSFTATWTVAAASFANDKILLDLDADAGTGVTDINNNALDGEWANPVAPATGGADTFPSGNGTPGGDFRFRLNVLPGDVTRSGGILGNDVTLVRNAQGFSPGVGLYTIFKDVNGSNSILGNDVTLVRNRQGFTLPAGEPAAPSLEPQAAALTFANGAAPVASTELSTLEPLRLKRLTDGLL